MRDEIGQVIFAGDIEEAKKRYPTWFRISQIGVMLVDGKLTPIWHVLYSSFISDDAIDKFYGRRIFTWRSSN